MNNLREEYKERIAEKIAEIDNLWILNQIVKFVMNITKQVVFMANDENNKEIAEIKELIADARKIFPQDLMDRTSDFEFVRAMLKAVIEKGSVQLE